jgi:hypothetical protein
MTQTPSIRPLIVNGSAMELPLEIESSLGELLLFLRDSYTTDSCCISSIRIDGEEISEATEKALAPLPITELQSIEILTSHPRELVQETLRGMVDFCEPLLDRAIAAAEAFRQEGHPSRELASLIDGIGVFTEALNGAKQILRIGPGAIPRLDLLEADLTSIMKDILHFYEEGQIAYVSELLGDHLVRNIREWKAEGLQELIRSRDS